MSCLPKCWKPSSASTSSSHIELKTEEQRVCFKCNTSQSVAKGVTVFVCTSCHAVNRLNLVVQATVVDTAVPLEDVATFETITLRRINSSTFVPLSNSPDIGNENSAIPPIIAPCSICLDAPGDMVFLSCNHGGFCEACARHIASNHAVGGACCVKCRAAIERLGRIVEVKNDVVSAVVVDLPLDGKASKGGPPRVPPPRGFNKSKKK